MHHVHFHGSPLRTARADSLDKAGIAEPGRFGRLFPCLQRLNLDPDVLKRLASTMFESVCASADNECIPAAYTYLAQFVDHDLTFDATTVSEVKVDPGAVRNFRTPALDLDCVYGAGPVVQPWLYERDDPDLLQTGCLRYFDNTEGAFADGIQADLPRSFSGFALIADPRNDENSIVAQLHLAFLHFHNEVVTWLRQRSGNPSGRVFEQARTIVIHHYQWIVLHDLLPRIVARPLRTRARHCSLLAATKHAFLPVEFSAAAYRFGHSMIRPTYNLNPDNENASLQQLFENTGTLRALNGGAKVRAPIERAWIVDWRRLLGQRDDLDNILSRRIDPYMADELGSLSSPTGILSLPALNLIRGNSLELPSGQSVAECLGVPALTEEQLVSGADGKILGAERLTEHTPLWYYVLKEAHCLERGLRLGPVGGLIVADVLYGLLLLDSTSILSQQPHWLPEVPSRKPGHFTLHDLFNFAGVLADDEQKDWTKARSLGRSSGRKFQPEAYVKSLRRR